MSQMATESPATRRRDNVFTRKIGPLPMWSWVAIIGGTILAWAYYKNRTAGSTSSATGTSASDVPPFVNQTYTTVTPPVAGPPGPPGPRGRPGPPGAGDPSTVHRPPTVHGPPPTRNPGGTPDVRTERLRHKGNLLQIARRNNIDLEDLLEANPELKKYEGTGKQLPVGTVVRIPPAGT